MVAVDVGVQMAELPGQRTLGFRKPFVHAALRIMRMPAKLAGLTELHTFLEHSYNAFHRMGDPAELLDTITTRETVILRQLYDGEARPFDITSQS